MLAQAAAEHLRAASAIDAERARLRSDAAAAILVHLKARM